MLDTDLGTVQASSGSTVNLVVSYRAWNRDLAPGAAPAIAFGVDGIALNVYRLGSPGVYPGKSETGISMAITVPSEGGTIYAMLVTTSTAASIEPGLQLYRDIWAGNLQALRFIPIGTLSVN